jgi:hypothetical protein
LVELVRGPRYSLDLWNAPGLNSFFPAVDVIAGAAGSALFRLVLLGSAVFIAMRLFRPPVRWTLAAGIAAVWALSGAATPLHWAVRFGIALATVGVLTLIAKTTAVDLVTFWVALFWLGVAQGAAKLAAQPVAALRWNALAAVAVAAGFGLVAIWMARPRAAAAPQRMATTP